jgi:two-component system response regulator DevR
MKSNLPLNRKSKTPVLLLEENDLAALYLQQILQRRASLDVSRWDRVGTKDLAGQSECVIIIDKGTLSLPFSRCLQLLQFGATQPGIVVIDRPCPLHEILGLMSLGVLGFVAYPDVAELVPAIKAVSQKQFWVKADAIHASRFRRPPAVETCRSLTEREKAVIALLQRRLSNKEISTELHISESTVKFHLANIFSKLGLRDRTSVSEAVRSVPSGVLQQQGIAVSG